MHREPSRVAVRLITEGRTIQAEALPASTYSLFVRFGNGDLFADGSRFEQLIISVNGEQLELGPFKLLTEANIEGHSGRLVPLEGFYDLERLVETGRMVDLQSEAAKLPLILARKEEIRPEFKSYVANLTYDLNVYKAMFDNLDADYAHEPGPVREVIRKGIIETSGRRFFEFLDKKMTQLEVLVAGMGPEEYQRHGFYLRKQLWTTVPLSPLLERTNLKPRGYSGDSVMMTMLYDNEYEGETTFGQLLHKHHIIQPGAQAVRARRGLVTGLLDEYREGWGLEPGQRLKVLSVASGPAAECEDIFRSEEDCGKYDYTFLDQDREALFEAAENVAALEKRLGTKIKARFLNESVRTLIRNRHLKERWGEFDFIYSMGLFDYLTPPVARAVLSQLYRLLKPGRTMVIGNFHVSNPSRVYMDYWLDWVLYYRTEEEFRSLVRPELEAETELSFEETGSQMFMRVTKPLSADGEG